MQPEHQHCVVDAHSALRAGTRDAHHALHTLKTLDALACGHLALDDYARLLHRLHGFYRDFDVRLATACDALIGTRASYRYHPRAPLLAADLHALGGADETVPQRTALPTFDDAATLAGALYVVEGSMLGAATLDRGARRVLAARATRDDETDERGRAYWAWARREAATRWARTLDLLNDLLPTAAACATAVGSAGATFTALHAWLTPLDRTAC